MSSQSTCTVHRLTAQDTRTYDAMLDIFAEAFEDPKNYCGQRPDSQYVERLLQLPHFFAFVARMQGVIVGAVAGYELPKFEQPRSELYIYDIAVSEGYRRRGVATALIQATQTHAETRGANVVFVQADYGDEPAIALYTKLGERHEVLHFDLPVRSSPKAV